MPFLSFIDRSPSPLHAALTCVSVLSEAGFRPVEPTQARWPTGPGAFYLRRGAGVVAWRQDGGIPRRFAVIGAHTDSPHLRLRPRAPFACEGCRQLGVEVYGGVLLNSWLDRDLGLAGSVVETGGRVVPVVVRRPVARIPQLAIHLDRSIGSDGLKLNPQLHLNPIWGLGSGDQDQRFRALLGEAAGIAPDSIAAHDLSLFDLTPSTRGGADGELLFAPRLDNLCSVRAGVAALVAATPARDAVPVFAAFDHEEVGSDSRDGAAGPLLANALERMVLAAGGGREDLLAACAGSWMLSADMAHAVHPNYADRHDPRHRPRLGSGPVIKSNHNQRYATTAEGAALVRRLAAAAGIPVQDFAARNDIGCGSTIGPAVAAALGMQVVDVGAPMLSMHSARECMAAADAESYALLLQRFLSDGPGPR